MGFSLGYAPARPRFRPACSQFCNNRTRTLDSDLRTSDFGLLISICYFAICYLLSPASSRVLTGYLKNDPMFMRVLTGSRVFYPQGGVPPHL